MTCSKVDEKNYFIILNKTKIGILQIGNTIEFRHKFGIGVIGILPKYRNKSYSKQTIDICKKIAKRRGEKEIYLHTPDEAIELQTIFRKLGFKGHKYRTNVYYNDCMFGMLNGAQITHLDLSNAKKIFKWQQLVMEL